jgi:hypothetical protein
MPEKGFRDNFFQMTRYDREFTFCRMCRDYFRIVEVFKILFVILVTMRMFYVGEHKRFFFLIFLLGFANKLFYYLVYKCLPRK